MKDKDEKLSYWIYTDKFEVRKYVGKTIGCQYLNNVIGIYETFQKINFDKLPMVY